MTKQRLPLMDGLLLLWEGTVAAFDISALMSPAPSAIAMALWRGLASGLYWEHIGVTGMARDACVEIDMVARRPAFG